MTPYTSFLKIVCFFCFFFRLLHRKRAKDYKLTSGGAKFDNLPDNSASENRSTACQRSAAILNLTAI
jgi:hypothetical protein